MGFARGPGDVRREEGYPPGSHLDARGVGAEGVTLVSPPPKRAPDGLNGPDFTNRKGPRVGSEFGSPDPSKAGHLGFSESESHVLNSSPKFGSRDPLQI